MQQLTAVVLLAIVSLLSHSAIAQTFPELSGRVVDQAQILAPEVQEQLSSLLDLHEAETSNQIVVLTVPSLQGYAIADYANRLGRAWQIGTAEKNNGVVLLVAPQERKVRIEVGYGLEGALNDAASSIIIQREMLPAFRSNDYASGISRGVNAIISTINGEYSMPENSVANKNSDSSNKLENYIPAIFIGLVGLMEILRRRGMRKAANGAFPAGFMGLFATLLSGNLAVGLLVAVIAFLFFYFTSSGGGDGRGSSSRRGGRSGRRGGGFGGGRRSGGGFSGGGGSFGGGGASGGW